MSVLRRIFETLRDYYELKPPMPWWPNDPVEVVVGAILVQGSTWKSVDRVLAEFRFRDLLEFQKILQLSHEELAAVIRPVGFHTKKAERLKSLSQLFVDKSGGDMERYFARDVEQVRRELLSISGIGPGTADNILLYAGQVPIYMVDTFTRRMLIRHGIADSRASDLQIQQLVHQELTPDEEPYGAKLFQDFQAFLVRLGRDFCDKTTPNCGTCPLNVYLPDGGAMGMEQKLPTDQGLTPPAHLPPTKIPDTLEPVEELVLDEMEQKVVAQIGAEPVSIDTVAVNAQLPVHLVRATIAILQMKKIVKQLEGNQVKRIR
jgi:endonuclease-3 related protein